MDPVSRPVAGRILTPAQRQGIISPKGWPGGATNTPGHGATCGDR